LRIGIVGTGFVAKARAEIFRMDQRTQLVAIAGSAERVTPLAEEWGISGYFYWSDLVVSNGVDVVVVCNANREHGDVVRQALRAGKSVIVDYPLALNYAEAVELFALADRQGLLLHTEHIELLTGVHTQAREWLGEIGEPRFLRYVTASPQQPAPHKWTYQSELFGFPLVASLSRLHRLIDLCGLVESVSCQVQYRGDDLPFRFSTCTCHALLQFRNGAIAEVGYHKGEQVWHSERLLAVEGSRGGMYFQGEEGRLITAEGEQTVTTASSKGLFRKDTDLVLEHFLTGAPLYTNRDHVLHAIATANACELAAKTQRTVQVAEVSG
jgi:biliverdin reductase